MRPQTAGPTEQHIVTPYGQVGPVGLQSATALEGAAVFPREAEPDPTLKILVYDTVQAPRAILAGAQGEAGRILS